MTKKIQLLEDELINKIAAGEVVERPASVLKELVENAIDSGAKRIEITLEEGGRRLIMVRDDGCGMSREDALLSVKRHATSKIRQSDDLFNVSTMGFRGEALASIAAVSHLSISTREADSEQGVRIEWLDGQLVDTAWVGPQGTTVSVSHLFYNMPARHAFLKSAATEYGHCHDFLTELALARPDLSFCLHHNNRLVLDVQALQDSSIQEEQGDFWGEGQMRHRFGELFKKEDARSLLYFTTKDKYGVCEGLISPPGQERGSAKMLHNFVNRRWVKDKVLRYAVLRGYHSHLLKGKYPIAYLHVTMDPALVDVNVHPAKSELRFQYPAELQGLIAMAIREQIRSGSWASGLNAPNSGDEIESNLSISSGGKLLPRSDSEDKVNTNYAAELSQNEGGESTVESAFSGSARMKDSSRAGQQQQQQYPFRRKQWNEERSEASSLSSQIVSPKITHSSPSAKSMGHVASQDAEFSVQLPIFENAYSPKPERFAAGAAFAGQQTPVIPWRDLSYIGSFASCYLLFEGMGRLLVVDQHAFHERILYERLKNNQQLLSQCQKLLVPELIVLDPDQWDRMENYLDDFRELGFEFKLLKDRQVELNAVPSILLNADTEQLVSDLISSHVYGLRDETNAHLAHHMLATLSCHSAVRAGELLDIDDVNDLLIEAADVDFYLNCPHGRRVFRWWKRSEVEHWFDR